MLRLKDIRKTYLVGPAPVEVLRSVDLEVNHGDFVSIMGASGSGKSTLMHIIGLLDSPTSGSYSLDGREVSGMTDDRRAAHPQREHRLRLPVLPPPAPPHRG